MIEVTPYQLQLLHHTLGVSPGCREPHRNQIFSGSGHHDVDHLEALVAIRYMVRSYRPADLEDEDIEFRCTDAGRAYALENLPHPSKHSKYQEYQVSASRHSFSEWLGIQRPCAEWNYLKGKAKKYRYVRLRRGERPSVAGEWKPTKKEAKASYKEALRKRRAAERVKP